MKNNLLIELLTEELPPKHLENLGNNFAKLIFEELKKQGLLNQNSGFKFFATPRRLAVYINNVLDKAQDNKIMQKLMPKNIGFNENGEKSLALLKKLKSLNLDKKNEKIEDIELKIENNILFIELISKGISLKDGIQNTLNDTIKKLPIPKVMTYQLNDGLTNVNFIRPAHSLIVLYGDEIIEAEILGLKANNFTFGHRFESNNKKIIIKNADSYENQLIDEGKVIVCFATRKNKILKQIEKLNVKTIKDENLLNEVTALVEYPNVLLCKFDKEFLDIPSECLILTMKSNQKYFPILDKNDKLTNKFLVISNINPENKNQIINGNERVIKARLSDAKFFFEQDKKILLIDRINKLDKIIYHNKLGTQLERVNRVKKIAKNISILLNKNSQEELNLIEQASDLAKADLLTEMVNEFPELQGIMGFYYAKEEGFNLEVAKAIEDHYKPRFSGDSLPRGEVGLILALADKLEVLTGLFLIEEIPTGERDPFALRRHALGIVRLILEKELNLSLDDLLNTSFKSFDNLINQINNSRKKEKIEIIEKVKNQISNFIYDRLNSYLKEQNNFSIDEINSVLNLKSKYLTDTYKRLIAVQKFNKLDKSKILIALNKRVNNILKKSEKLEKNEININLLIEESEKDLYKKTQEINNLSDKYFSEDNYDLSLEVLINLNESTNSFFENVLVNSEDKNIKINRLNLLNYLYETFNKVADISYLSN